MLREVCFGLTIVSSLGMAEAAEMRRWTDSTGQLQVEAEFVELKDGIVIVRRPGGDRAKVAIDRLSESDQQYVRNLLTPPQVAETKDESDVLAEESPTAPLPHDATTPISPQDIDDAAPLSLLPFPGIDFWLQLHEMLPKDLRKHSKPTHFEYLAMALMACAPATGVVASVRGRSFVVWSVIGLFVPILSAVALFAIKRGRNKRSLLIRFRKRRLLRQLNSFGHGDRINAMRGLVELGETRAVMPLCQALSDKDSNVRRHAAEALGRLGDPRAGKPLITALSDENKDVRQNAANALKQLDDSRVVEPLIAALGDKDKYVVETAIEALSLRGDSRALEPLCESLNHPDEGLRQRAAGALGRLGDARAVEPLISTLNATWRGSTRAASAAALGRLRDSRAFESLCKALSDPDVRVSAAAASALGQLGDQRALKPLGKALCHVDVCVCCSAAEALGQIGDPRAIEPLIRALDAESILVKEAVILALGRFDDSRVVEPIVELAELTKLIKDRSDRRRIGNAIIQCVKGHRGLFINSWFSLHVFLHSPHIDGWETYNHTDRSSNSDCTHHDSSESRHGDNGGTGLEFPKKAPRIRA